MVKKVQVGNDQEKAQSEIHTQKPRWEKTKLTDTYTKKTYCKLSEQLFPNRQPLSYLNLTQNIKAYIRLKQHKILLQNVKQIEPEQKYRLGRISDIKLLKLSFVRCK